MGVGAAPGRPRERRLLYRCMDAIHAADLKKLFGLILMDAFEKWLEKLASPKHKLILMLTRPFGDHPPPHGHTPSPPGPLTGLPLPLAATSGRTGDEGVGVGWG